MKKFFQASDYEKIPLPIRRLINSWIGLHLFKYPYRKLKIIGVTGTSGKTTTTTLLYRIAMSLGYKAGLIGTVENYIGEKKIMTDFTTPLPLQLNKLLSEMEKEECKYVFMEVSSHGLEEKRVAGIQFAGAVFTNLSHDHLDFHGNMESYFLAKRKLFETLPKTSFALTNVDDECGLKILKGTKAMPFSYGIEKSFDDVHFHGEIKNKFKKLDMNGLDLAFNKIGIKSKLLGKFNAYNLLAVWSTCSLLGFDMNKVNKIIENMESPRGRFEHFMSPKGVLIVIDYAHKPDALKNVLNTINEIKTSDSKVISVFGCGGDRDASKRPIMGKIGATLSDVAIFTSDNPRSEDINKIIEDMKISLSSDEIKKVKIISDRREAIKEAIKLAVPGDIILCAGKGHEAYQEIKGVKNHFDDIEEFKKELKQK